MRPDDSEAKTHQNTRTSESVTLTQGFLADCMVDADPITMSRAGRVRGRAFGISALAQACLLTLVLIVPLFATGKLTPVRNVIPIAPYGGPARRGQDAKPKENQRPPVHTPRVITDGPVFLTATTGKKRIEATDVKSRGSSDDGPNFGLPTGDPNSKYNGNGLVPIFEAGEGPRPPQPEPDKKPVSKPIEVSQGAELGRLVYRLDPVYPSMALRSHTEGTVQLRAIIGRDGVVRDLQVLSGNAVLAFAAQEAVKQWRFRPTMLNGQPVEVDTFITVVFRIRQ